MGFDDAGAGLAGGVEFDEADFVRDVVSAENAHRPPEGLRDPAGRQGERDAVVVADIVRACEGLIGGHTNRGVDVPEAGVDDAVPMSDEFACESQEHTVVHALEADRVGAVKARVEWIVGAGTRDDIGDLLQDVVAGIGLRFGSSDRSVVGQRARSGRGRAGDRHAGGGARDARSQQGTKLTAHSRRRDDAGLGCWYLRRRSYVGQPGGQGVG